MSLLTNVVLYLVVGCAEWYLALRRTLACARGEKLILVSIVFIENLLGLWVLSNFVRTNNWSLALSYSGGASAGALLVAMKTQAGQRRQSARRNIQRMQADPTGRAHWPCWRRFRTVRTSRAGAASTARRQRVAAPT
ncbi:MAG: hypothetical protein JW993_08505 [Sedimentisphaerales bacterium]|nr:hypothetical protein [Sedimentisphaerales bacterium]